ncbi:MAG: alpha-amylase family glycosyl hydrolase [Flavobacteriaceae bacterium]|nr:alpha-amylase family glycosyl hydrolase [Flavobacteriaceae bacterium]
MDNPSGSQKKNIYQVFTRLFGNTNTNNIPWGTLQENGVGKFSDFSIKALNEIKNLGITHIWYTGVLQHATVTDYTQFGIDRDDPRIVKGRAGSPYAIKDYYNVNPDLANNPADRLQEFKELISRTHSVGLKVIIDLVPNHVARNYNAQTNPGRVGNFGEDDNHSVAYSPNNNFYYDPESTFKPLHDHEEYKPLGNYKFPKLATDFVEIPAKWTGNGSRSTQPQFHDWFETVKINYGISPEGRKDFKELPRDYNTKTYSEHYHFWESHVVPDSWVKFRDISKYWLEMGVDGFRYDMAEMVPVEFWSYLNSFIKTNYPGTILIAEVYNPTLYRDYIFQGQMDYLYNKVQLYDTLRDIIQNASSTDAIQTVENELHDIAPYMLNFLENHDEQRIASPEFAGNPEKGKPAMVVAATISSAPTLIYFGQEVGEPAVEDAGFGKPSRTSIFDYVGVPSLQRWVNDKKFDGGKSTVEELQLREFYSNLLNFTLKSPAILGKYYGLHHYNLEHSENYGDRLFSFSRWTKDEKLIIVVNFSDYQNANFKLKLPRDLISQWDSQQENYILVDQLNNTYQTQLKLKEGMAETAIELKPLESFILKIM